MIKYYVYIIECSDSILYTGFTANLERRLRWHNEGYFPKVYTALRRPVKLIWSKAFVNRNEALKYERQIKGWTRRKKVALIENDFEALVKFSRNAYKRGLD